MNAIGVGVRVPDNAVPIGSRLGGMVAPSNLGCGNRSVSAVAKPVRCDHSPAAAEKQETSGIIYQRHAAPLSFGNMYSIAIQNNGH